MSLTMSDHCANNEGQEQEETETSQGNGNNPTQMEGISQYAHNNKVGRIALGIHAGYTDFIFALILCSNL